MSEIEFERIKSSAVNLLEEHASELGAFLVRSAVAFFLDRKKAKAAIDQIHSSYVEEFESIRRRMEQFGKVGP